MPFLALRSYLPPDHPDKHLEIGSEATPADFLDVLLDLTEEWARVLAPHGSICVELGDTYSGSGGAGGDYSDGGWREGQNTFDGSARRGKARESRWSYADAQWLAALIDAEGSIAVQVDRRDANPRYAPVLAVSMNSPAMIKRADEIAGVGNVHQKASGVWTWSVHSQQARYVLLNVWPYLMVKQEQAKAAIELARHVEERRCGRGEPVTHDDLAYRESIRLFIMNLNDKGGNRGRYPNDWQPPTPPHPSHNVYGTGNGWPMDKGLCGIPTLYAWSLAYGRNLLRPERTTDPWRIRNVVAWCRPNPPIGALGDKFRPATSYLTIACKSRTRWFDLDAVRSGVQSAPGGSTGRRRLPCDDRADRLGPYQNTGSHPNGAPPLDWWEIPTEPYKGSHYATWPRRLLERPILAMCPLRVCTVCGEPSRRIVEDNPELAAAKEKVGDKWKSGGLEKGLKRPSGADRIDVPGYKVTLGWSDCGHNAWRNGVVLDPFAGTGTTLAVATGHGRDAIGIDIDERNADLALERIGPLLLTVEHHRREGAA